MIDCALAPLPTDATRGTCPACDPEGKRPIPIHAHRNCRVPPEPRPESEWELLKAVCWQCPNRRPELPAFWCALDERQSSCVTGRAEAYRRRLTQLGGECGPWQAALAGEPDPVVWPKAREAAVSS